MLEQFESRLTDLTRRAGLAGLPPAAVAAVALVLGIALVAGLWRWWPRAEQVVPSTAASASGAVLDTGSSGGGSASPSMPTGGGRATASPGGLLAVHVVGAVRHPGVYELAAAARVCDAIAAAGGFSGNAAQAAVNLARPAKDGEQIVVPTEDEYAIAKSGTGVVSGASGGAVGPGGASAENPGAPPAGAVIDINSADAAALDTLPGVGPSTAAKIVADRESNGPFASADDLGRVSGIGPKKLEQLRAFICVQ